MAVNIITAEDFEIFKIEFLTEFERMLGELKDLVDENRKTKVAGKQWLKSHQVQRMLGISPGTLQNLRINGTIPFSKVGGVLFYAYEDILLVMKKHKRNHNL